MLTPLLQSNLALFMLLESVFKAYKVASIWERWFWRDEILQVMSKLNSVDVHPLITAKLVKFMYEVGQRYPDLATKMDILFGNKGNAEDGDPAKSNDALFELLVRAYQQHRRSRFFKKAWKSIFLQVTLLLTEVELDLNNKNKLHDFMAGLKIVNPALFYECGECGHLPV